MDLMEKLTILTEGAKYDAACTSSGSSRPGTVPGGCCHSFAADGRCISVLKVLMTNYCVYDCKYCVNRVSADCRRAAFTPAELSDLTMSFYRRNYIEGLFLSSGVLKSPDHTMEQMIRALEILRHDNGFQGYIHAKTIPGASPGLVTRLGLLADRLSINIELPSEDSLGLLAPQKSKAAILDPMRQIQGEHYQSRNELVLYKNAPVFAPAGQATQMIIGASPESDYQIINLASALYKKYRLRRVFYSAYIPAVENTLLPAVDTKPPLLREHRLYQADFMIRFYGFSAGEILTPEEPNFNPYLDPKCNWAIHNMHLFPMDINRVPLRDLMRIPGVGPTSAQRIITARKNGRLGVAELKRIGVVLKRARYFLRAADWPPNIKIDRETAVRALIDPKVYGFGSEQLSMFGPNGLPGGNDLSTVADAVEEATLCLAAAI